MKRAVFFFVVLALQAGFLSPLALAGHEMACCVETNCPIQLSCCLPDGGKTTNPPLPLGTETDGRLFFSVDLGTTVASAAMPAHSPLLRREAAPSHAPPLFIVHSSFLI